MAENMEWENEAPQLAKLKKSNPFTVPENYFDELGERINQCVFINSLQEIESSGFNVPENYFDTLATQITSRVALEQFKNEDSQGFVVPKGYFENLQQNITAKTVSTENVKKNVKSVKKTVKLWHQPLFKYVVAASLVIVSTTGWFANKQYQNKQLRSAELAREQLLYDIDESLIVEYVQESQNTKTANVADSENVNEMEDYILDNFSTTDLSNNL